MPTKKKIARATVRSTDTDYRHEIDTGSRHQLIADEPPTAGGDNAGPAPYDYILSGLGACTAITLRMYAQRKDWDLGRVTVELQLLKDEDGNDLIERKLSADGALDDAQWEKLLDIADKTPVTRTLLHGTIINTHRA